MGAASSKFVTLKDMPLKRPRSKSRSQKKKHKDHHRSKPTKPTFSATDTTKAVGGQGKPDPYKLPPTPKPKRKPKVWVVAPDDVKVLSTFPSEYLRKRRSFEEDLKALETLACDLKEIEAVEQAFPEADPTTLAKNRKFIIGTPKHTSYY